MSGNEHFEEAAALLADEPREYEVEKSKAIATLALAYEQRTANLIALLDAGYTSAKVAGVDYAEVADSIKERLGL